MSDKNVFDTLGDYMRQVFDADNDGIVSFKEVFSVFPNMAVPIAIAFVDVLVLAAEYRVWDFGMYVTGDPIKAAGFVLVSAVPFLFGQIFWLYPRATWLQKFIAIGFVGMSLYTSAEFGLADLTAEYNANDIFTFLVQLTAGYIVGTLVYIVFDPTIKANRMKRKAQDAAVAEKEKQAIARSILTDLKSTLETKKALEDDFGKDEVANALSALSGKKMPERKPIRSQQPMQTFASTVEDHMPVNPTPGREK
jgi:hypothetical protein